MKKLTMKDFTMYDLANGVEGEYKGKLVVVEMVGRMSYLVTANGIRSRLGGVDNVKKFVKQECK